jgi:hypothetical protein
MNKETPQAQIEELATSACTHIGQVQDIIEQIRNIQLNHALHFEPQTSDWLELSIEYTQESANSLNYLSKSIKEQPWTTENH